MQSQKGFTLIEMIVAVTLVAMMAAGLWSIFRTGIRSWSRGTDAIDTSQRHRILHDLLRKQMASAFPLAISLDQNISTMSYPLFNGTETSMQFVSLNSLRFQDSPGLTLVRYDVNEDTDSDAYALVESEQRYLGQSTDSEETLDLFNSLILYGNLSSCTFAYRSPDNRQTSNINLNLNTNNAQEESEEWVSEWNGQEKGQLPIAIAMNLESMDENGDLQTRRIVVPIQATEEYSQTSSRSSSGISRQPRRGRSDGRGGSGRDRSGRIGPDRGGFGDMSGRGRRGGRGGMPGIGGRGGRGDMPGRGGRGGRGGMPGMGPGGMPGGSPFNGDRSSGGGRR